MPKVRRFIPTGGVGSVGLREGTRLTNEDYARIDSEEIEDLTDDLLFEVSCLPEVRDEVADLLRLINSFDFDKDRLDVKDVVRWAKEVQSAFCDIQDVDDLYAKNLSEKLAAKRQLLKGL